MQVDAQIYIFALYTGPKFTQPTFTQNPNLHNPKFTQDPNSHAPRFTPPQIYKTQIYTNPDIHSLKYTQNPNFHSPNITQTPILQHQNLHQIIPNIFSLCTMCFITFLDIYLRRPLPNQGGMIHHNINFRRVSYALVYTWFD